MEVGSPAPLTCLSGSVAVLYSLESKEEEEEEEKVLTPRSKARPAPDVGLEGFSEITQHWRGVLAVPMRPPRRGC